MKLSEAILLGSMKQPKITGQLYSDKGTCAIGAAFDCTGKLDEWKKIIEQYGNVRQIPMYKSEEFWKGYYEDILNWEAYFPAPYTEMRLLSRYKVINIIVLLNDSIGWSRENIAKWVATIEKEIDTFNTAVAILESEGVKVEETVNV